MVTLSTLPLHQTARIGAVGGGRAFRRRLLELGFLPGVDVVVRGVAPLGDPLDVEVRGCRFSLRHTEAACITVVPAPAARALPSGNPAGARFGVAGG